MEGELGKVSEIQIWKSDFLPERTIIASRDVYEAIKNKDKPEQEGAEG